jgi:four helix bundle protein
MATYDLEDRTLKFAQDVRKFTNELPRTSENIEDIKQLTRASASVGANYLEANESLGDKDKIMHLKISKKESKECRFFARLVDTGGSNNLQFQREKIIKEATEIMNILGSIIRKLS